VTHKVSSACRFPGRSSSRTPSKRSWRIGGHADIVRYRGGGIDAGHQPARPLAKTGHDETAMKVQPGRDAA
jgi:hypothetical protein